MENGEWFSMEHVQVNTYRQELDLQRGMLSRYIRFTESKGREIILQAIGLVHMEYPHLATLQWTITPLNWSGRLRVRSGFVCGISNGNVDGYREINANHYRLLDSGSHKQGWLTSSRKPFNLTSGCPKDFERKSQAAISSFNGIFKKWI